MLFPELESSHFRTRGLRRRSRMRIGWRKCRKNCVGKEAIKVMDWTTPLFRATGSRVLLPVSFMRQRSLVGRLPSASKIRPGNAVQSHLPSLAPSSFVRTPVCPLTAIALASAIQIAIDSNDLAGRCALFRGIDRGGGQRQRIDGAQQRGARSSRAPGWDLIALPSSRIPRDLPAGSPSCPSYPARRCSPAARRPKR